jgi:hypothetical protein
MPAWALSVQPVRTLVALGIAFVFALLFASVLFSSCRFKADLLIQFF